jgi:hypothetical protein
MERAPFGGFFLIIYVVGIFKGEWNKTNKKEMMLF